MWNVRFNLFLSCVTFQTINVSCCTVLVVCLRFSVLQFIYGMSTTVTTAQFNEFRRILVFFVIQQPSPGASSDVIVHRPESPYGFCSGDVGTWLALRFIHTSLGQRNSFLPWPQHNVRG